MRLAFLSKATSLLGLYNQQIIKLGFDLIEVLKVLFLARLDFFMIRFWLWWNISTASTKALQRLKMSPSTLWLEDFRHEARKNMHLPDASERSERSARMLGSCEAHRLEAPMLGVIAQNQHLGHDQNTPFVSCRFVVASVGSWYEPFWRNRVVGWGRHSFLLFATFHHFWSFLCVCNCFCRRRSETSRHVVGNRIDALEDTSGALTPVFVDHDRSSHAERQALLVIIAMLKSKKGRDRFGDLVLAMHLGGICWERLRPDSWHFRPVFFLGGEGLNRNSCSGHHSLAEKSWEVQEDLHGFSRQNSGWRLTEQQPTTTTFSRRSKHELKISAYPAFPKKITMPKRVLVC